MAWWAWVVAGWSVASLAAALVLGMASAEVARGERRALAQQPRPSIGRDDDALIDPAVVLRSSFRTARDQFRTARRRVPGSRPGTGGPPAGPARDRGLTSSGPVPSPVRHRLARRPGEATPPDAAGPVREVRRAGHGPGSCQHREPVRRWHPPADPTPDELARRRRLLTTASPCLSVPLAGVAAPTRRVRTPPVPAGSRLHRLGGRRARRALMLACLPVIALGPLLASSTSSLGKNTALAAELAAHPDQEQEWIAALDRGRVLAGLTTPVTAPRELPAPADPTPAPGPEESGDGTPDGTPTVGPSSPAPAPESPTSGAPVETGQPTRSVPSRTPSPAPAPGAPTPSTLPDRAPTSGSEQPQPSTTSPAPTPTPSPTPTSTPTPTPTPSPTDPTATPTPTPTLTPTPTAPTPTGPEPTPTEPEPTATPTPTPRAGGVGDGLPDSPGSSEVTRENG